MTTITRTPQPRDVFSRHFVQRMAREPWSSKYRTEHTQYHYANRWFRTLEEVDQYQRWVKFHREVTSEYLEYNAHTILRWAYHHLTNMPEEERVEWSNNILQEYFPGIPKGQKVPRKNPHPVPEPQYDPGMIRFMNDRRNRLAHNSVCMVYPVTYPGSRPESHCTLVYLGNIEDCKVPRETLQLLLNSLNEVITPGRVKTTRRSLFGPNHDQIVWELESPSLQRIRRWMDLQLARFDIYSASEYVDYHPHVTVRTIYDPREPKMPEEVYLGLPVLWWGEDRPTA